MTGPIDDHALRAGLRRLTQGGGLDADELATGAMRRGRQRRQRQRGALASVAAAAALAVAVPTLAAPGSGDAPSTSVASTGEERAPLELERPREDKRPGHHEEVAEETTLEEPDAGDEAEEPKPDEQPAAEPKEPKDPGTSPPPTEPKPESPPTTDKPAPPELELLELWCGRGTGEEAGGVVCEVTISEHPDFGWYELRRRCADEPGLPWETAATFERRAMPERPWPDIRFFDPAGEPQYPWLYQVLVHDSSGKVIGKSNVVKVMAAEAEAGGGGEG